MRVVIPGRAGPAQQAYPGMTVLDCFVVAALSQ